MMSASTKRVLAIVLGATLLLGVPACLQSTSDPGSELNPQPLPPQDPEKQGSTTTAPGENGDFGSSSSGSSSGGSGTSSGGVPSADGGNPDAADGSAD